MTALPTTSPSDYSTAATATNFVDRRSDSNPTASTERRQFTNSHASLSPDARELAEAIDSYKVGNRRRYITFEEMLLVITQLGYEKKTN